MTDQHIDSEFPAPVQKGIDELLREQLACLGISKSTLVERWGYSNTAKGLRRLDQIATGVLVPNSDHLAKLAIALELSVEVIMVAIAATKENMRIEERATTPVFEPHGVLVGCQSRPSSIAIYGITGGADRWLKIRLDVTKPPISFVRLALAVARTTPFVPFHGKTTGFVINYTPVYAVRFDLAGDPVEVLTTAYLPGRSEIAIGGRRCHRVSMLFAE